MKLTITAWLGLAWQVRAPGRCNRQDRPEDRLGRQRLTRQETRWKVLHEGEEQPGHDWVWSRSRYTDLMTDEEQPGAQVSAVG